MGLQKRGYELELLFFPDEGHALAKLENRPVVAQRMVKFLQRTIANRASTPNTQTQLILRGVIRGSPAPTRSRCPSTTSLICSVDRGDVAGRVELVGDLMGAVPLPFQGVLADQLLQG